MSTSLDVDQMRLELLEEIDEVLHKDGIWRGGRLDTIKWLVARVQEAATKCLDDIAKQGVIYECSCGKFDGRTCHVHATGALQCACGHRFPAPLQANASMSVTCPVCDRRYYGEEDCAGGHWVCTEHYIPG